MFETKIDKFATLTNRKCQCYYGLQLNQLTGRWVAGVCFITFVLYLYVVKGSVWICYQIGIKKTI